MSELVYGRYVIQKKIGEGGMGAVFCAFDRLTDQTVALKRVLINDDLQVFDSIAPNATIHQLRTILAKEFQILAGLRHPNIISVLDYGFDAEQQPFYTMTYLAQSQTILQAGASLDTDGKLNLIEQLLQGLAYLHRRGILHRDIKPENVLVVDGEVKLLDFGLSQAANDAGEISGSPLYLAPELFDDAKASIASDLYTVGVLIYQLLNGQHPFGEFNVGFYRRLLHGTPDYSTIDQALQPLVRSLLAKSPDDRPASANQLLHLLAVARGRSVQAETAEIRESYLQSAAFVGREQEMAQLRGYLDIAAEQQGIICLLSGESGVGKSRLLDEFRTHALVSGWQVITGQEVSEGGAPYQLWRDIVARLALNTELSDLEAGVLQEIVPDLPALLERQIPPITKLSGSVGEQRLVLTLIALLQRQPHSILLILEDLHWSTTGLVPLMQMLKIEEQLPGIMVVGSYRDDERPRLPEELPGIKTVPLDRLNESEVAQLSQAMLGEAGSPEIVSFLTKETEGNTFFIVEVMRVLAEEAGRLIEVGVGDEPLPREVLTNDMEALLQRRINRVLVSDRKLLRLAAVAGRQLDLALLSELRPDVKAKEWLQRVSDAAILTIRGGQWLFSHDKLRQAAMNQLNAEERIDAHQRVAAAIEQLYPDDESTYSALLTHWRAAGNDEKELTYLLPVVDRSVDLLGDYEQGFALSSRGLTLLPPHDKRRIPLLNLRAELFAHKAKFADGERVANEALALAQELEDGAGQATSLNILGYIYREQSLYSHAKEYFERALKIGLAGDEAKGMARSLLELGIVAEFQKDYEAAENYFKQNMEINRRLNDQIGLTRGYFYLGMLAAQHHNDFETSILYAERNLEIFKAIGNQRGVARCYKSLGIDYASTGQYAKAREYFHNCLSIIEGVGDRSNVGHTYLVLGEAYFFEGTDYETCLHYQERSLQMLLDLNALAMVGINYGYISLSHLALGNYEKSLQSALDHFELQTTIEFDKSNGLVHTAVAQILAARDAGQLDGADVAEKLDRIMTLTGLNADPKAFIQEAIKVSTIAQIRMVVLIGCAKLAIEIGEHEAAKSFLSEAREKAERVQNRHKLDQINELQEASFA